jgi:spermidine synthase
MEIVATDRPGSFVVRLDGRDQSLVDLLDPTRLEFDYVRRMADVIDDVGDPARPLSVLHIGGAGLTLPRYVAATRPGSRQVVLEPDEALTARVRSELPLPRRSGIRVRGLDGRRGLPALRPGTTDVVVLDAYRAGVVPGDLLTVECFDAVARVLTPGGVLVANLSDRAPFSSARDVVAGLERCFRHLAVGAENATLKGRRPGNVLIVASRVAPPVRTWLREASATGYRVLTGARVKSSFGGGTALRDRDLAESPAG